MHRSSRQRQLLEAHTGVRSIPTLLDGTTVVSGADAVLSHLNERFMSPLTLALIAR
jgi:hypothetical protein